MTVDDITAPTTAPATLDTAMMRRRRSASDSTGSRARRSATTNPARSTIASGSVTIGAHRLAPSSSATMAEARSTVPATSSA